MNFLQSIGAAIASVGIFIGSLFGFSYQEAQQPTGDELGRAVNPVAGKTYVLAGSGISSTASSITLTSFTIPVSNRPYTMAHFGDTVGAVGYLTIEPGNPTRQEFVSFTGITQNADGSATLTGVSRGLAPVFPYTASSTYAMAHSGGAQVVISNAPQLYEAIYSYIDNATTSGAVDATPTIKGLMEVATGREAASTTASGLGNTTAPLALTSSIATSTSPTSGNYVVVTNFDGNIDTGFFPDTISSSTIRIFTASATYTRPIGLKHIVVEVQGAGGNGSADGASGDAGGGGGGYARSILSNSQLSATTSVVIGTAGIGSGNTSFGSITAGNGGNASNITGGTAGSAAGGNILNISGEAGTTMTTSAISGGAGGDSYLGRGGVGGVQGNDASNFGSNGQAGFGYGAGGGGAGSANDGAPQSGAGAGTAGVVLITEYF